MQILKSRQRGRGMDLKDNGWGGERKNNLRSSVLDAKRNLRVNVMQGNVLGCFSVLDAMRNLESQSAGKCDAMHCVDSAMT